MAIVGDNLEKTSLKNQDNWKIVKSIDYISIFEDKDNNVFWGHCENDGMVRVAGPFSSYDQAYEKASEMLKYIF